MIIMIDTNLCVWFISYSNGFRRVRLDLVLFYLIGASYIGSTIHQYSNSFGLSAMKYCLPFSFSSCRPFRFFRDSPFPTCRPRCFRPCCPPSPPVCKIKLYSPPVCKMKIYSPPVCKMKIYSPPVCKIELYSPPV